MNPLPTLEQLESGLSDERLPSGLRLLVLPVPYTHRVTFLAYVPVGSRYELEHEGGISHLLEHMLFRGTPTCPSAAQLALMLEELGGTLDAATGVDHGTWSISVPVESHVETLRYFAEVLQQPLLQDLETELSIVEEEIAETLDEKGRLVDVDELTRAECFGPHPLGRPIAGFLEQVRSLTREQLLAFHAERYVGEGMVLVVTGPVDAVAIRAQVGAVFASLRRGEPLCEAPPAWPSERRYRHVDHADSQTQIRLAFPAPPDGSPDREATELLLRVVDDGFSTRLYRRVCEELGLCYEVFAEYETHRDAAWVLFGAECTHDRVERVAKELTSLAERLAAEGPTEAELEKARRRYLWQWRDLSLAPESIADALGDAAYFGRAPSFLARRDQMARVTLAEVREIARKLFSSPGVLVTVGKLSARSEARLRSSFLGRG